MFGPDYKPEPWPTNYHREQPKDGRPCATLFCNPPIYVHNDDAAPVKIKKLDNRDWHEEPPKNREPYTILESDPPLYEYKEITNPAGGEPVKQTLGVPLLEIPAAELPVAKKGKQTSKKKSSRKRTKKKQKKEDGVSEPEVAAMQQNQPTQAAAGSDTNSRSK